MPTSSATGGAFIDAGAALRTGGGHPGVGNAQTSRLAGIGKVLSALVVAMLAWPLLMRMLGSELMMGLHTIVSLATGITLLIWIYQLFAGLGGKQRWSPAMAVAGWLIPLVNLVLPPVILRAGWRAVSNDQGGLVPFLWWPLHLASAFAMVFWRFFPEISGQLLGIGLAPNVIDALFALLSWGNTLLDITAYGLLLYIVRTITKRA